MALGFVISGMAHSVAEFYIGMGIFMGVGFAALPMTSQATFLSNWFIRKRGMAIGTAASGIGLGILIVVPLTQRFLDRRFLGNHPLAIIPLAAFLSRRLRCLFPRLFLGEAIPAERRI